MLSWQFKPQPERGSKPYAGVTLVELILRAPVGGKSGGEISVAMIRDGLPEQQQLRMALEPGIMEKLPETLSKELESWLISILKENGLAPEAAEAIHRPVPAKPTPEAPPPGFGPILG